MRQLIVNQPETAEYIEKLIPRTIDEDIAYAGSIEFRFSQYTNSNGFAYPIPGLKTTQKITYMIKTNSRLSFKPGDIIRFGKDDKRRYTITKVDFDNSKSNYRKTYLYPNTSEQVQFKIITLE